MSLGTVFNIELGSHTKVLTQEVSGHNRTASPSVFNYHSKVLESNETFNQLELAYVTFKKLSP